MRNGTVVEQVLQPRFKGLAASKAALAFQQDPPQSETNELAFWGRGAATTWTLTISVDAENSLDLSGLSYIELELGYRTWEKEASPQLVSCSLSSKSEHGQVSLVATIGISAPAPAGGFAINLGSSRPTVLPVPGRIVVPAGKRQVTISLPVDDLKAAGESILTVGAAGVVRGLRIRDHLRPR